MPINKKDRRREHKQRLQEEARQKEWEAKHPVIHVQSSKWTSPTRLESIINESRFHCGVDEVPLFWDPISMVYPHVRYCD
jgi:hypothetical protein